MTTTSGGEVPVIECARAGYAFLRAHGARLAAPGVLAALFAAAAGTFLPLFPGGAPPSPLIAPTAPLYVLFAPLIGAAASAQGLPSASGPAGLIAYAAAFLLAVTHLSRAYRTAMGDPAPPAAGAALRLARAILAIAFFFAVYWIAVFILLVALFAAALQSLGLDAAALEAIGSDVAKMRSVAQQALATAPGSLVAWAALAAVAGLVFLTARLALSAPATVMEGRVLTFRTWAWTRGATLRIVAAGALVIVPLLIVAFALASLVLAIIAAVSGAAEGVITPAQLFLANLAFALPLTLLVTPAMAGLSAYLYRGLRPPTP